MARALRVTTRNASFQQWQALLTNRTKRQRAGEFVVQGVRPITLAVEHGWPVHTLIYPDRAGLSAWARETLESTGATPVAMDPDLVDELAGKESAELLAIVAMPPDHASRIPLTPDLLVVVFDRPTTPGNVGTLIRSADAFGAAAVVVTGHAADPYDPAAVRASTGSIFAIPVIRADSHREVVDWVADLRADGLGVNGLDGDGLDRDGLDRDGLDRDGLRGGDPDGDGPRGGGQGGDGLRGGGLPVTIAGTDEDGTVDLADHDLTGPHLLVIGNETHGLSAGWREACDAMLRIPITGAASSLNAAAAGTVALYETHRQRSAARPVS